MERAQDEVIKKIQNKNQKGTKQDDKKDPKQEIRTGMRQSNKEDPATGASIQ